MDNTKLIHDLFIKYKTYDPFILCELLNIEITYVQFNMKPLGQAIIDPLFDAPIILLDNSLKENKSAFFVCSHELCHILKHKELLSYYESNRFTKEKLEVESNYFAVKLAISSFKEEWETLPHSFEQLNFVYGIPLNFEDYYF